MFLSPGLTQHTMEQMLERAGVPREINLQGPTEVHPLSLAWGTRVPESWKISTRKHLAVIVIMLLVPPFSLFFFLPSLFLPPSSPSSFLLSFSLPDAQSS